MLNNSIHISKTALSLEKAEKGACNCVKLLSSELSN